MNDYEPCLMGCDHALAEAERLIAAMKDADAALEPELSAVRHRIALLRDQVEQLRGLRTARERTKLPPNWTDLAAVTVPWPAARRDLPDDS